MESNRDPSGQFPAGVTEKECGVPLSRPLNPSATGRGRSHLVLCPCPAARESQLVPLHCLSSCPLVPSSFKVPALLLRTPHQDHSQQTTRYQVLVSVSSRFILPVEQSPRRVSRVVLCSSLRFYFFLCGCAINRHTDTFICFYLYYILVFFPSCLMLLNTWTTNMAGKSQLDVRCP